MKTDRYTQAILTLIAFCLLWLCLNSGSLAPASAHAADGTQEVVIVGMRLNDGQSIPVRLTGIKRYSYTVNADGPKPYDVKESWEALPVCNSKCN